MTTTNISPLNSYNAPSELLAGRTVLVTGATQGIGQAVALGCARAGATVVLLARDEAKLDAVYDEIENNGYPTPVIVPFDLESAPESQYQQLAKQIEEAFGQLHGLVHCAGLLGELKPLAQYDAEMFQRVLNVNLHSNFLLTKALIPALQAADEASIIFSSSSVGRQGRAYWGAYAISKFAVEGLMQTLADELRDTSSIRCNSINPKATRTAMRAKAYPAEDAEQLPTPEQIAPAYLYLLGSDSRAINGQQLDARD